MLELEYLAQSHVRCSEYMFMESWYHMCQAASWRMCNSQLGTILPPYVANPSIRCWGHVQVVQAALGPPDCS